MKYFNFLGIILIALISVIQHTESMAKGHNAYINISQSNEQNEENIDIKINGKKCTQIKDGDLITLSLPGHYKTEDIESIKWYINFKQTNNQEYKYLLSEELYCSFINKPKIFQCYFSHPYNSVLMGFDWGNFKKEVCPNDCYFSCIFSTSNKGKTISAIFAQNLLILKFCHLLLF